MEVSEKKDTVPESDLFRIVKITVSQSKDEIRYRFLKIAVLKALLCFRLEEYLQATCVLDDNTHDENETTPEISAANTFFFTTPL